MDLTTTNKYFLPNSILNVWSSRQKFDVQIDAITSWTVISVNKTSITGPTKPPSQPTNLRIYATQQVKLS